MDTSSIRSMLLISIILLSGTVMSVQAEDGNRDQGQDQDQDQEYSQNLSIDEDRIVEGDYIESEFPDSPLGDLLGGLVRICNLESTGCMATEISGSNITLLNFSQLGSKPRNAWLYNYAGASGGEDYYSFISSATGKCLDVKNPQSASGSLLTTKTCCTQCASQWWRHGSQGPFGSRKLINLLSEKCADMPAIGGTNWDGSPIWQVDCVNNYTPQFWRILEQDS